MEPAGRVSAEGRKIDVGWLSVKYIYLLKYLYHESPHNRLKLKLLPLFWILPCFCISQCLSADLANIETSDLAHR